MSAIPSSLPFCNSAAVMAAALAGTSLTGVGSVPAWGAAHAVVAALLVAGNRYASFQRLMKALIALMALCVLGCALVAAEDFSGIVRGLLIPTVPAAGGGAQVLALLGGIGGSVTVICYGYWMRSAGWRGAEKLREVRGDVRLAYVFTGLFGVALVVIAAGVHAQAAGGSRIALEVAERLGAVGGTAMKWVFLAGFWCTVFTAMLGVWQGVPQIFADLAGAWGGAAWEAGTRRGRRVELGALALLAGPPLVLLWFKQPVTVVVAFSITGALVMPFIAGTLLYLNNRRDWMGPLANGWRGNVALGAGRGEPGTWAAGQNVPLTPKAHCTP